MYCREFVGASINVHFCMIVMLFYIIQKQNLHENCIFFEDMLPHNIPGFK